MCILYPTEASFLLYEEVKASCYSAGSSTLCVPLVRDGCGNKCHSVVAEAVLELWKCHCTHNQKSYWYAMRHCLRTCQSSFHHHTVVPRLSYRQDLPTLLHWEPANIIRSWKGLVETLSCDDTVIVEQCLADRATRMHLEDYTKGHRTLA